VAIDENDALVPVEGKDHAAVWQFVDAARQQEIVAEAAAERLTDVASKAGLMATDANSLETSLSSMASMDKTSAITNPTMYENTSGWTVDNIQGTAISNGSYQIQNAAGGQSMTTQTVTGLASGIYKVQVQSFYRASSLARCTTFGDAGYVFSNAYFRANDNEVLIRDWYAISFENHTKPNSRGHIKDEFNEGEKYTNTVYTYVGDDGTLKLTIAVPSFSAGDYPNWICYNNVRLTYYYNAEDLSSYQAQLAALVNAAIALVIPARQRELLDAVVAANNKEYTTSADYQAAIDAVNAAIEAAKPFVEPYADYLAMKQNIADRFIAKTEVYADPTGNAAAIYDAALAAANAKVEAAENVEAVANATTDLWAAALAFLKSVTINEGKGFDLTWMIQNADFSDSNYKKYWTEQLASSTTYGVTSGLMRYYNSSFDLSQTLPYILPAGAYRMKMDGFERTNDPMDTAYSDYVAGNSVVTGTLYLNNNEQLIMNLFDVQTIMDNSLGGVQPSGASFYTPNGSSSSAKYLAAGLFPNTLIGVLAEDALITIGYRCANTKAWTCFDNFQLEYIGEVPQATITVTADELTPLCVPFTLDAEVECVSELYAVGTVVDGEALLYPVSKVQPGVPCVARLATDSYTAAIESTSSKTYVLPWDGGTLVPTAEGYTWEYVDLKDASTPASELTFTVMDWEDMKFDVSIENLAARKYLSNVTYTADDESVVAQYNVAPPTRRDIPNAVMIPLPERESSLMLTYANNDAYEEHTMTLKAGSAEAYIYNLLPQQTYVYTVTDNGTTVTKGEFTTTGNLRMVYAPSAYNIRDLGGWLTQDGARTAYGHLFRGSTLNGYANATAEDLQRLRDMGVGAELDLRYQESYDKDMGCGTSAFGFTEGDDYYFAAANDYLASDLNNAATKQRLKAEFEFILKHFRQGKAVYYHCAWGADRTGFFTLLLEGILGVELDQIYKDYELTSFSAAPGATNRLKTSFQDRIDVIQAYSGATLRDKFEKYFRNSLGVSQEDIDYFREVMINSDETVGISQPSTIQHSPSTIYDLQGRRLTSPTRPGLYIVNGKKIAF
jgi:protein-tyrosine phosphatase